MSSSTLDAELPAGNIRKLGQEGDTFIMAPDPRDTEGFWFYWKFRVCGAAGRRLTFRFEGVDGVAPCCVGARGPAVSRDRGASWSWQADVPDAPDAPDDCFHFTFGETDAEVWFSMCLPYGVEEWDAFLSETGFSSQVHTLCTTPKGNPVPLLELDRPTDAPGVILTARSSDTG